MADQTTAFARLQAHWVYGGALAGVMLVLLTPVLTDGWPLPDRLLLLALAAYMLHQYEEHDADRFRRFVGQLAGTPDALTLADVFWINILGVWAVLAAVLWMARSVDPGWGAIAGWFLLINAAGHGAQALAMRRANPGLVTALFLFVPLGLAILFAQPQASVLQHGIALVTVVVLHGAILARVAQNRRKARQ